MPAGARADSLANLGEDVRRRCIVYVLGRVEPQPIEVKLVDPIPGIGHDEVADTVALFSVVIDRGSPLRPSSGQIGRRELGQIVPVRTQMVVDDVQNDTDPEGVRAVDECAKIVGCPV